MDGSMPGFSVPHHLLGFVWTHVHWVGDAIQPSHPLSSPSAPAFNLSVFSNESALPIRWPEYWNFSFSISPSNEYSVLISFRIDWFDLLAVQGTLKSLLQYHNSKASKARGAVLSRSVMSDSLRPHGRQHARLPCPSLSPGVCSNSCPLSQWWYLTISSSAALYFCLQSFPASGSFPMSWLFASGGQSIWVTLN